MGEHEDRAGTRVRYETTPSRTRAQQRAPRYGGGLPSLQKDSAEEAEDDCAATGRNLLDCTLIFGDPQNFYYAH